MLDPLTSLGLASNIVQLVDFGLKTAARGRELATKGATAEHKHLETITKDLSSLCADLDKQVPAPEPRNKSRKIDVTPKQPPPQELVNSDRAIRDLAHTAKDVADELLTLLQTLSINKPSEDGERPSKRRRTVASRLVKSMWKEKEVQSLRLRMNDLQQEMMIRLSVMQTASSSALLRSPDKTAEVTDLQHAERLSSFEELMRPLLSVAGASAGTSAAKAFAARLDKLQEQMRTVNVARSVLKSLAFEKIHNREDTIPPTHANTFSWIFDNLDLGFVDWASNQNGVFWVTGKPGSGKSTLMKYLVGHPHTKQLLQQWAGVDELIEASHYFWNAGTAMQQSQIGLLRTLLFHITQRSPEAVLGLVPERFGSDEWSPLVKPWTYAELFTAIKGVGNSAEQLGTRLCFFIDGLDEYVGEHTDLVELLSALTECPSIKICVSSRPWNPFTRAYDRGADGQLAMQDLTEPDIRAYITDKMSSDPLFGDFQQQDPDRCLKLVDTITMKAQGVFLWVHLVVRSLLKGLGNDDDLDILEQRLSEYPDTLNAYFQRMFDRIEKVYRNHSSRILLAALSGQDDLSFLTPRCMELELTCADYARLLPVPEVGQTSSNVAAVLMCTCQSSPPPHGKCLHYWAEYLRKPTELVELRRYLDARCADFIDATSSGLEFIHRTAKDFLMRSGPTAQLLERAGDGYDVGLSFARYRAAETKIRVGDPVTVRKALDKFINLGGHVQWCNRLEYTRLLDQFRETGATFGIQQFSVVIQNRVLLVRSKIGKELCVHRPVHLLQSGECSHLYFFFRRGLRCDLQVLR